MPKKPYRTSNQKQLMSHILTAAGEGKFLTVSEVHAAITYGASYGAVRKSLTALEEQDMIQRQKRGRNTIIVPTQRGYDWFRPKLA